MLGSILNGTLCTAYSEIEELTTGIPDTEKKLQEIQLELAQVQKDEALVSAELRCHRAQVEETRSSMQANRSRGRVLDSLMEQKRQGHLPGIFGRLVSQAEVMPAIFLAGLFSCIVHIALFINRKLRIVSLSMKVACVKLVDNMDHGKSVNICCREI